MYENLSNLSTRRMDMQTFDSETLAEKYSQLTTYNQLREGKDLFSCLNTKHGEHLRVLDMGCGTGELTAFMADALGKNSEVVGVDPDLNRINIAIQENSRENLSFIHGESSSRFPHYNEAYYDLHFSNFVVQWLSPSGKEIFLNTAFRILKPGGRIAIQSLECDCKMFMAAWDLLLNDGIEKKQPAATFNVKKSELEHVVRKAGFEIQSSEYKPVTLHFESLDVFLDWVRATLYIYESKLCLSEMENFVQRYVNQNGSVDCPQETFYQIIAVKCE